MKRFLALVLCLFWAATSVFAADISGQVRGEEGRPLARAEISIPALKKYILSDEQGIFTLKDLAPGTYTLQVRCAGYAPEIRKVKLDQNLVAQDFKLYFSAIELPVLTVTAKPQPSSLLTSPQSVSVLEGRALERMRGRGHFGKIVLVP